MPNLKIYYYPIDDPGKARFQVWETGEFQCWYSRFFRIWWLSLFLQADVSAFAGEDGIMSDILDAVLNPE